MAFFLLPLAGLILCILPFRRAIRADWRYLVLLAIPPLLFLFRYLIGTTTIVQKDANLLQIPFFMSYRDSILGFGQSPLWNPYVWSGIPNLAHPLSHVFHPTAFLSLLMPVHKAFNLSLVLMLFFAECVMFLLMRELGQPSGAALVSAIVYAFNEFTLDRLGAWDGPGVEYLYSYAMLPLSLTLLLRTFKTKDYSLAALFGLSLAFVMNGNPSLLYYGILLCLVVLASACAIRSRWRSVPFKIGALLAGLALLVLVDSIELIPFLELQRNAGAARLHEDILSGWRMAGISLPQLPALFLPILERVHFGYGSRVGWIALALVLLSLTRLRREDRRTIVVMFVLLGFGVLLLTRSPLFTVMWRWLPLFRRISMIPSVFILFMVPMSVLAGIGSKALSQKRALPLVLALLIFAEIAASSAGWFPYDKLPRIDSFDYVQELADFPHLAALNPGRVAEPWRIECRGASYRSLCPEDAIMHYRLRLVNGDKYMFPPDRTVRLLDRHGASNLLDVKYILSQEEIQQAGFILKEKVHWEGLDQHKARSLGASSGWDGTVYVYQASRNEHAFLVDDSFTGEPLPRDQIPFTVIGFSPMRIQLEGYAPRPGMVFVSEPAYPGWVAIVDGARNEIREVAGGFIGVPVGSGQHSIVLQYDPASFKLGFWITLLTVLAVGTVVGLRTYRASRDSRGY